MKFFICFSSISFCMILKTWIFVVVFQFKLHTFVAYVFCLNIIFVVVFVCGVFVLNIFYMFLFWFFFFKLLFILKWNSAPCDFCCCLFVCFWKLFWISFFVLKMFLIHNSIICIIIIISFFLVCLQFLEVLTYLHLSFCCCFIC